LFTPTQPMITESVSAGFYELPYYGQFTKIQILTVEDLLSGKAKPSFPDMRVGGLNFKKAKRETNSEQTLLD
jgi:hypothetical protein